MIDCFALLEEPRRPWLDSEELKQKFLALSTQLHPDRVHHSSDGEKMVAQQRYAELNAAYQRLRDPKDRLLHLLELELGTRPQQVRAIPAELMDLSMEVARLCRQADAFLSEKSRTSSPLLQVQLFERGQEWTAKLAGLESQIRSRQEQLEAELKQLDAEWQATANQDERAHRTTLTRLDELSRLFAYYGRSVGQLQERVVQLSF